MGAELAFLRQGAVQRQHADVFLGGAQLEQRLAMAGVGGRIHPGGHAVAVVDLHGSPRGVEHHRLAGFRKLAADAVPAGFGEETGGGQVLLVLDVAGLLARQALDQTGIDTDPLQHGGVGPAGVSIDAVEHQRLIDPAALVEALGQLPALAPVAGVGAGDVHHVFDAGAAGLVLLDDPALQLVQRHHRVFQVCPQTGVAAHHRMAVAVDQARHHHLAVEVEDLGSAVGQRLDVGIAANLEDLAVFHGNGLRHGVAFLGGEHLAIEQHQVGRRHGLH
ncbi:hypothetical protein D9M71_376280 [compost metagenome]